MLPVTWKATPVTQVLILSTISAMFEIKAGIKRRLGSLANFSIKYAFQYFRNELCPAYTCWLE